MDFEKRYYTQQKYEQKPQHELTSSMEDYLEMICRLMQNTEIVRVQTLSRSLHVNPSSVSKMMRILDEKGFIKFERYGYIMLTTKGRQTGNYLLHRHQILHRFLCLLNDSENELEQVEKIEHFIDKRTVKNIEKLMDSMIPDDVVQPENG